ncbi:MAG: helix-turn-helix domain-containing protein, partial [Prevotella sp.]|nr:helix-turn-helix domain-containing protein [Prevotella sp.]
LYKILYELRGNVSDLRRDMNSLRKQLDEERALSGTQGFQGRQFPVAAERQPIVTPDDAQQYSILNSPSVSASPAYDAIAEEINEPGNLNLNDLGRQMVEKALERNGGNRKKAAQELGISDRTLYRRIKQYGLEKE